MEEVFLMLVLVLGDDFDCVLLFFLDVVDCGELWYRVDMFMLKGLEGRKEVGRGLRFRVRDRSESFFLLLR